MPCIEQPKGVETKTREGGEPAEATHHQNKTQLLPRPRCIQKYGGQHPNKQTPHEVHGEGAIGETGTEPLLEGQTDDVAQGRAKGAAEGEKFLAENATKEGVKTTESGLQYKVITEGDGPAPGATDEVTVHYVGTLINGEEFDSSIARGQPVTFPLGNVIEGWTEGLQLMKTGSKYQFFIPAKLGYGERGAGVKIGPNQTLIFEVELLGVNQPAAE